MWKKLDKSQKYVKLTLTAFGHTKPSPKGEKREQRFMDTFEHKLSVKPEGADDKVEMELSANLEGLDLNPFVLRGLKDFAANAAKPVRDGNQTAEDFIANFQDLVEKYSRGEVRKREGGGKAAVDTTETLARRYLASQVLKKHAATDFKFIKDPSTVPGFDNPPATKDGKVNFIAWAKLFPVDHPWMVKAIEKVSSADEDFS